MSRLFEWFANWRIRNHVYCGYCGAHMISRTFAQLTLWTCVMWQNRLDSHDWRILATTSLRPRYDRRTGKRDPYTI